MPSDRGEYRPFFCRILNGPDFLRLSGIARACLWPLKLRLPASGIGVLPALVAVLAEDTGFSVPEVEKAITELEASPIEAPSRDLRSPPGWLYRQGSVVWLVRGLEFEPTLNPNDSNHRKHIQRVVASLPTVEIVSAFKQRYAIWFDASLEIPPEVSSGAFEGPGKGPVGGQEGSDEEPASTTPTTTTTPTTKKKPSGATAPNGKPPGGWPAEFSVMFKPIGCYRPSRIGNALKIPVDETGVERSREVVAAFVQLAPHQKADGTFDQNVQAHHFCTPERLAQTWGFWLKHTEPIGAT